MSKKGKGLIKVLLLVILVGMIVASVGPIFLTRSRALSGQQAGEKAIAYINENFLTGETTASLGNVLEESGVYKIIVKIDNQEIPFHITKDGRFLFDPRGAIDLELKPETAGSQTEQKEIPKSDNPEVHLYTMSFCPYGNQAEEVTKPVVELLGNTVKIEPHYVIYENYASGYPEYCLDEEKKYCSMHGINELNQDIREMCVYQNQNEKFWSFLEAVNKDCNVENVEECWQKAAQKTGVNINVVKSCQKENAINFSQSEKALNEKYQVSGSPALVINGVHYTGARTPEGYKSAICNAFNNPPEDCSKTLESTAPSGASTGGCQ